MILKVKSSLLASKERQSPEANMSLSNGQSHVGAKLPMPESIKEHGIWIVLTNPVSYSEPEMQKLGILVDSCKKKQIPLFTCRAADLPNGWTRK
jgi:hypothetical protein